MSLHVCAGADAARAYLMARTGCALTPNARTIQALRPNGEIMGVVAFDCWTATSAVAHVALDTPIAARALLHEVFRYAFEDAGRRILVGMVSAANKKALRLDRHVGFVEVARIRDGVDEGVDMVVLELRKENCRYLRRQEKAA